MPKVKDIRCITPGCMRERIGTKFCRECAEASKQASIIQGKARFAAKKKAERAAKKVIKEAKAETKLCPICKVVEIPLRRHYCDACRDESIKAKKRESQRSCRQREKTGPVHYGFGLKLADKPVTPVNPTPTLADTIKEVNEMRVRRERLNPAMLAARLGYSI